MIPARLLCRMFGNDTVFLPQRKAPVSNVTSLHETPASRGWLRNRLNLALLRHWERLRGERPAPDLRELNLREIAPVLGWLGIVRRRAESQRYDWRLAGSALCELWGEELTGREALGGLPRFERETLLRAFDRIVTTGQPALARLSLTMAGGAQRVSAEMLALPLRDEASGETLVALTLIPDRYAGQPGLLRVNDAELSHLRMIWTEPVPGMQASQAAPAAPARRAERAFRVIEGGLARRG